MLRVLDVGSRGEELKINFEGCVINSVFWPVVLSMAHSLVILTILIRVSQLEVKSIFFCRARAALLIERHTLPFYLLI